MDGSSVVNAQGVAEITTPTFTQQNADWNSDSGVTEILNKPNLATVATSGSYDDLTDKPTIPAAQVNADWNADSGVAEILNKPFQRTYAEFKGGYRATETGKFDLSQASEVDCGANADNIAIDQDNHWDGRDCYYFPVGGMYRVTLALNVQSTSSDSTLTRMDYGIARKDSNDAEETLAWEYFTLDNVNPSLVSVHMHATVSVAPGDCLTPYIHSNDSWYASVSINYVSFEKMGVYVVPPDPYNPYGLPEGTFRIQMSSSSDDPSVIFAKSRPTYTRVPDTEDQWDCHVSGNSAQSLLSPDTGEDGDPSYAYKLIRVLGANATSITSMRNIFAGNKALVEVALFDMSNVTDTAGMFGGCTSLTEIPQYDTSNVMDMGSMFYGSGITSIPALDTSSAWTFGYMFASCAGLTDIMLPASYHVSGLYESNYMFWDCVNVETGITSTYTLLSSSPYIDSQYGNHSGTFENCGTNTQSGRDELDGIPSDWK